MKSRWDKWARCPFFCREDKERHRIVCEGIAPDTRLNLVFLGKEKSRIDHLRNFCCDGYENCPLYHGVSEQYENRED